ncbi:uncharacterized protein LOC141849869 [Brevipalpus obovatus]|uniref:uncharacterized protein LOC141849869 n=1 Tax=Brevipalpus obovatus TaxID=246614 RepID=UPI003D9F3F00
MTATGDEKVIDLVDEDHSLISKLNDDCFFDILSFIPCVREKLRLRRVSKRFRDAIDNYFLSQPTRLVNEDHLYYVSEKKPIKEIDIEIPIEKVFLRCPRIISLNTCIFPFRAWWDFDSISALPSLVELVLKTSHPSLSNEYLQRLLLLAPNLESLTLIDFVRGKRFEVTCLPKSIRRLEFQNPRATDSGNRLVDVIQYLGANLVHLKISASNKELDFNDELVEQLISFCPALESLHICFSPSTYEPFLKLKNKRELVIHPALTYLNSADPMSTEMFTQIIKNNPNVTKLHLPIAREKRNEFFKKAMLNCPEIVELDSTCGTYTPVQGVMNLIRAWQDMRRTNNFDRFEAQQAVDNLIRAAFV